MNDRALTKIIEIGYICLFYLSYTTFHINQNVIHFAEDKILLVN